MMRGAGGKKVLMACLLSIGIAMPRQVAQPAVAKGMLNDPAALAVPANFIDEPFITGLAQPRAFAFTPDGRVLLVESGSETSQDINVASIRVFKNGQLLTQRAATFNICGDGERGLLGIALDPDFENNGYLYVYYSRQSGVSPSCQSSSPTVGPRNRVSRLKMTGDVVDMSSERVLIDTIYTETGIHNAGDLHFSSDGYLYISVGENGDSTLAQQLNNLNGKILRIKPSTDDAGGYSTSGNPFDTAANAQSCGIAPQPFASGPCREVYAYGFRNPFRFAIQEGGANIFVNDVGGGAWEEVDKLGAGSNYGWPVREGPCNAGNLCNYPPLTPSGFADPIYAYSHFVQNTLVDTAVTGGAFIPGNTTFPAEYHGNYIVVDGYQGFMRRLADDAQTLTWEPVSPDFSTDAYGVISLQTGPDGNLYYIRLDNSSANASEIRRIRYGVENAPPVAKISANPISSPNVNALFTFSAAGSLDPDFNYPLSYAWDFGDGATIITSALTVTHSFASAGVKNVSLIVTDSGNPPTSSVPASIQVFPGNQAPQASIQLSNVTAPSRSKYHAGDTWAFSAVNVTDDQPLPPNALSWSVVFHHETHTHPFLSGIIGSSGQFTIPTMGEYSPEVWYRVVLHITDAQGLTTTFFSDVNPETTTLTLDSKPAGATLQIDSMVQTAPFTVTRVVGIVLPVNVISSTLQLGNEHWQFFKWSDGGQRQHSITVSPNATLTAQYVQSGTLKNHLWLPLMLK